MSAGEVDLRLALAILDLDDPEIGIEPDFPLEPLLGFGRIDPLRLVYACEQSVDPGRDLGGERLRRGSVERRAAVETVDLDDDRAGFRCAATTQDGDRTL